MRFDRGFTLLEVLTAVGVFALSAVGLMLALQGTLDGAQRTQRDAEIRNALASRLDRLSIGPLRSIDSEDEERGVTYHAQAEREEVLNAQRVLLRGFWRLRVTAKWLENNEPQTWTASHLVYRSEE